QRFGTAILASISQVGPLRSQRTLADHFERWIHDHPGAPIPQEELDRVEAQMAQAEIRSLDAEFAQAAGQLIKETRIAGDSLGAAVEVVAVNVPALLGEPLYQSLKVRLMGTLGGLNAAQSCEIGAGREVVERRGSENNDPIRRTGYQRNS